MNVVRSQNESAIFRIQQSSDPSSISAKGNHVISDHDAQASRVLRCNCSPSVAGPGGSGGRLIHRGSAMIGPLFSLPRGKIGLIAAD
jgi:hypothetical protein